MGYKEEIEVGEEKWNGEKEIEVRWGVVVREKERNESEECKREGNGM